MTINSKHKTTLQLWNGLNKKREFSLFEKFIVKHRKANDDALMHIQFCPNESEFGWSGPVCIASLGRFFLKFKRQQSEVEKSIPAFATVHIVEEGSTLVLRYYRPPHIKLPYRIENCLRDVSITFYQKVLTLNFPCSSNTIVINVDCNHCMCFVVFFLNSPMRIVQDSSEPEVLGSESSIDYVWDDVSLPHKLVARVNGKYLSLLFHSFLTYQL